MMSSKRTIHLRRATVLPLTTMVPETLWKSRWTSWFLSLGFRLAGITAVCLMTLCGALASDTASTVSENLRTMVGDLRQKRQISINGKQIVANRILIDIYAGSGHQPLWQKESTVRQLISQIRMSERDGLEPEDYHLSKLTHQDEKKGNGLTARRHAERDLMLTDALIRLAANLYYGKVDPRLQNPRWPLPATIDNQAAVDIISSRIRAGQIDAFIGSLRPNHPMYHRLANALAAYRKLADAGGWPAIPSGPLIEKGDHDPRVPLIRQRLLATGDLPPTSFDRADFFSEDLQDATCRFQDRHRIDTFARGSDDCYGAVGADTREQMNVSVKTRIDQIRINLERARWVMHHLPLNFLIADIADFSVALVENDRVIWRTRSQVGDAYRKTPVFRSKIRYMEINPTWTVPPGILDTTLLPGLRKNPHGKLLEQYVVWDRNDKPVDDPAQIPWDRYTGATLPYRLVQQPGPANPMGQIKFIFPNPDFVFIHDTPKRSFFDLERRDLSAGCIRIENPFELAKRLLRLDGQAGENRLQQILNSSRTERIHLKAPFPIILFYGTVSVDAKGMATFRPDIYERDRELLEALDAPAGLWEKTYVNRRL